MFFCAPRGEAQGFGTTVVTQTGNQPVFVATADVNADGIPDLIYIDAGATPAASTTHVLLGDGKGGFKESAVLATAGVAVAVGDLLGNGHVDVGWLTSSQTAFGMLLVWHVAGGVGDGTFVAAVTGGPQGGVGIPAVPQFGFMKAAEIRGQANTVAQIVAVDTANGYLFSLPIQVDGVNSVGEQLVHGAGQLTLGDLNGDSYDDVLVDGLTDFTEQTFLGAPTDIGGGLMPTAGVYGVNGVHSLVLQDFNGDGKLDIAVEGPSGRINVFAGNGDGTFEYTSIGSTTSADSSNGDGGSLIAAADLNGDGRPDLLAYTPAFGVSVELGTASGNFTLSGKYPVGTGTHSSWATADFNGDGFLDVAVDTPGGIAILYGQAATESSPGVVSATPNPVGFEAAYSLIATMAADTGAGAVTFTVDGTVVGSPVTVVNGVATLPVAAVPSNSGGKPLLPGSHALGGTFLATNSALGVQLTAGTLVVNKAPDTPVLTPTTPQTVYFGGPVNGTVVFPVQDSAYPPTTSWTLTDNGYTPPVCVDIPVNYLPGCPYGYPTLLNAGGHSFVITYNGDAVNAVGASVPYVYTVLPDPTVASLSSSGSPSPVGAAVRLRVVVAVTSPGVVTEVPTGTVTWLENGGTLGVAPVNASGEASLTISTLTIGAHTITAAYAPSAISDPSQKATVYDFVPSVTAEFQQVIGAGPLTSVVTLQSSLNPSVFGQVVTFTAGVSVPGPFVNLVQSGTVTFLDGTTVIGTGTISKLGLATFSTSALVVGSHPITASYAGGMTGTQTIEPSVSPVLTQVVESSLAQAPPGFVLTVTPNPTWVPAGQTAALLVTVRAVSGYAEPVALTCSGTPGESTCGFFTTTIPAGGGSTTLQIATTAPHACGTTSAVASALRPGCSGPGERLSGREARRGLEFGGPMLAGLMLLLPRRRRRVLLGLVMLVGFVGLNGCGNCTDLGTSLGSYTVTVTGTAAGTSQSVAVKLTVLPQ